jgi:DNA-damage-inducible protein J
MGYTNKKGGFAMPKDAFIRARTSADLKRKVEDIFAQVGLNTTEAINLFFVQVQLHNGLPFAIKLPNAETLQAIDDIETSNDTTTQTLDEFKVSLGL